MKKVIILLLFALTVPQYVSSVSAGCDLFASARWVHWSPDGRFLLVNTQDHLRLYDTTNLQEPPVLFEGETASFDNIFSDDSRYLVTHYRVYDLTEMATVRELDSAFDLSRSYQITGDGDYIYSPIGVWETVSGDEILNSFGGAHINESLSYAYAEEPDRGQIWILVVDLNQPDRPSQFFPSGILTEKPVDTQFNAQGDRMVVRQIDPAQVRLFNPLTGDFIAELDQGYPSMQRVEFSPSGDYLLTASRTPSGTPTFQARGDWRLWDSNTGALIHAEDSSTFVTFLDDDSVLYYPQGHRLQPDGLFIWREGESVPLAVPGTMLGMQLAHDQFLVIRTLNSVIIWDVEKLDEPPNAVIAMPSQTISAQLTSDATRLITVHEQAYYATPVPPAPRAYLWDTRTGNQVLSLNPFPDAATATPTPQEVYDAQSYRFLQFIADRFVLVGDRTYADGLTGAFLSDLDGARSLNRHGELVAFLTNDGVYTYHLGTGRVEVLDACD